MKANGYQIREAMKRWQVRKEIAAKKFPESLTRFEGDDKKSPKEVMAAFREAENAIADLQTAQQQYNIQVNVRPGLSLALAIKRLGGASRAEKMLKDALGGKGRDEFAYLDGMGHRDKDAEYAKKAITEDELREELEKSTEATSSLREAIATANATQVELDDGLAEIMK